MKLRLSLPLALTLTIATIGFSQNLITAKTPSDVQLNKEQVSRDEAEAWERVNAFAEQGNLDKAIATLEGLVQEGSTTVAVYQKLGDLYLQAGRNPSQAETAYTQAIQLAKTAGNVQAQAEAQVALAKVKMMLGKNSEASSLLNQAKAAYQGLGNTQKVSEIQQQITALSDNTNNGGSLPRPVFRGSNSDLDNACKIIKSPTGITLTKQGAGFNCGSRIPGMDSACKSVKPMAGITLTKQGAGFNCGSSMPGDSACKAVKPTPEMIFTKQGAGITCGQMPANQRP